MTDWRYYCPTKIIFGDNSLGNISDYIKDLDQKKILLVTGQKSMKKSGITDKLFDYLKNYDISVYDQVEPNPSIETLSKCIEQAKQSKSSLIVSLGGGSAIDTGKATAILLKNDGAIEDYLYKRKKIENKGMDFIAIPTTAGSGSEVTPYAVITDKKNKKKLTLSHEFMYPRMAIIDPVLTLSLSKRNTAITGIDALSHALEAYWSKNSQEISDNFALKSINLIFSSLEKACNEPGNLEYRRNMSLASLLAGMAFSNTGTNVCHAVSYPLTTYFDVPHGLACGLTLSSLLEYNKKDIGEKMTPLADSIGASYNKCSKKIEELIKNIGLPARLSELGITKGDMPLIIDEGFIIEKFEKNIKSIDKQNLEKILHNIF